MMIRVSIHTPDRGTPPEFRDFNGELKHHAFESHYEAALFLLGRCDLAELRDLHLYRLRELQRTAVDQPYVVETGEPVG